MWNHSSGINETLKLQIYEWKQPSMFYCCSQLTQNTCLRLLNCHWQIAIIRTILIISLLNTFWKIKKQLFVSKYKLNIQRNTEKDAIFNNICICSGVCAIARNPWRECRFLSNGQNDLNCFLWNFFPFLLLFFGPV